jgi:hypothetical protein
MKEGLIHFVACTSTLAQGVNLPIRYLIVTGVYQGGERILVRDFHNLIGRAGRAGMHTEGSVIFADTRVFDKKLHSRDRWRWRAAKELLDHSNSEPSASSISAIFDAFAYGDPTRLISLDLGTLHDLVFDDDTAVEAMVQQIAGVNPGLDPGRFRKFLQIRVKIVHGIASFILAHLDFASDGMADRAAELGRNTLAYHLSDEHQRTKIEILFRNIAVRLVEGATEDLRTALRRSPLAPTSVSRLRVWLNENRASLLQAAEAGTILGAVTPIIVEHNKSAGIAALSDQSILPEVMQSWVNGTSFAEIWNLMIERNIRLGGNRRRPIVEDAVGLCEGALGYEAAMIVATISDLAEGEDDGLHDALSRLQGQIKTGLPSEAAVGFFEAGFADREVAQSLGAVFPDVSDRYSARLALRGNSERAGGVLSEYPAYFSQVLNELGV